jgi:hypothetical protein
MLIQRLSQFGGKAGSEHVEGGFWLESMEVEASKRSTAPQREDKSVWSHSLGFLVQLQLQVGTKIVPSYLCSVMVASLDNG